jgi:regulator of telomere elongation helicase 1
MRVPDGVLVAFASYAQMDRTLQHWKEIGIWERLQQYKQLFIEPRQAAQFKEVWDGYSEACVSGERPRVGENEENNVGGNQSDRYCQGAIIFAICRGKLTEGKMRVNGYDTTSHVKLKRENCNQ